MTNPNSGEKVKVRVFLNPQSQLTGEVFIKSGYRCRLSDVLNNAQPFLALTNVQLYGTEGNTLAHYPFLCINKQTIQWVLEEEVTHPTRPTHAIPTKQRVGQRSIR